MNVLIACESSGIVRSAFRLRGHNAWSCDLLPAEDDSPFHICGDALDFLGRNWDLLVAHPPCTRLCNSGVRWLEERNLWMEMEEAATFFKAFLDCSIPKRVIENPIPHRYAASIIGPYTQIIHPCHFGHAESKATCLWLRGIERLVGTQYVAAKEQRIHRMPPSPERWRERSRTYPGIAKALAEQYG